ncbi:hypothetical protein [Micromonospora schwarzwaldensis]|uniref:hypothetical protein n=1 Tax=Micromonospora sp. DSM 45708 TaxID=3111767 RepID=UPI0031DF62D9
MLPKSGPNARAHHGLVDSPSGYRSFSLRRRQIRSLLEAAQVLAYLYADSEEAFFVRSGFFRGNVKSLVTGRSAAVADINP